MPKIRIGQTCITCHLDATVRRIFFAATICFKLSCMAITQGFVSSSVFLLVVACQVWLIPKSQCTSDFSFDVNCDIYDSVAFLSSFFNSIFGFWSKAIFKSFIHHSLQFSTVSSSIHSLDKNLFAECSTSWSIQSHICSPVLEGEKGFPHFCFVHHIKYTLHDCEQSSVIKQQMIFICSTPLLWCIYFISICVFVHFN